MKSDNTYFALALLAITLCGWILFYPNSRFAHSEGTFDSSALVKQSQTATSRLYYESVTDSTNVNWLEYIPVFHYWVDIPVGDYFFDVPTADQIASWQNLCEKENPTDSALRSSVQKQCLNMSHTGVTSTFGKKKHPGLKNTRKCPPRL